MKFDLDPVKLFIGAFFGFQLLALLSVLVGIAGLIGAGSSLFINEFVGHIGTSSILGGSLAGLTFYFVYNVLARFLSSTPNPPFKDYASGGVAYFLATIGGTPLGLMLFAGKMWAPVASIVLAGVFSLAFLALFNAMGVFKLFPSRKKRDGR